MRAEFLACGLTETEYDVFHHLLTRGSRSAGVIAKTLGIKRSTVYSALEHLEEKKLVTRSKAKGTAEFMTISPSEVSTVLFNRAREHFEGVLSSIELLKPRLSSFKPSQSIHAGALEINHIDGSRDYYELIEKYCIKSDFCALWNPQISILGDEKINKVRQFLTITAKRKNKIQDILARGPVSEWYCGSISNPNHEVRFLDGSDAGLADTLVAGDSVIMSLNSPDDESALEVINPHYATFMRWFFNNLWARLPKAK